MRRLNDGQCFFCRGNNFLKLFEAGKYTIGRCPGCGLVFTLNSSLNRLRKSRSDIYEDKEYLSFYLSTSTQKELTRRAKNRLREISQLTFGKKILEVGCGRSPFLGVAKSLGWDVRGVEPCHEAVEFMEKEKGMYVYEGILKTIKPKERFNVICYWDVLEHLEDPVSELKLAMKYLIPGGILALQVPNFGSVSSRLAKERFDWLCPEDHLVHFTPRTLRMVLEKSGFEVLTLKTWSGGNNYLSGFVNDLLPGWPWFRLAKYLFVLFTRFIDRFFPWPGMLLSRIESIFLVNGLIIAYARKNEKE